MLTVWIPSKRKKLIMSLFLSVIIYSSMINTQIIVKSDITMWLKLDLKTYAGGVSPDIGLFIADYLEDIGIDVTVIIEEWGIFVNSL
ncbi:MAG: hypothetical protein H7641_12225, partial [Candidatus Heimdallarchaeota archaeon]|nr:hypothetical protein [Candidatus Heimdallarchaeota archaeon]MCK4878326.1 hypothetical protein [Candidatus Heimdallarchaeota archaeon]